MVVSFPQYSNCKDFQASQDISVAFFGLDWTHVFKEIDRIQSTVEEMTKDQNHPTSSLLTLGNWCDSELSEFRKLYQLKMKKVSLLSNWWYKEDTFSIWIVSETVL